MASIANPPPTPTFQAKQKHVTTACLNCRTRKIKCDAGTPSCSNCILYAQQCNYQHGLDKRKISIKNRLTESEAYVKQLEALIIANGIPLPSSVTARSAASATNSTHATSIDTQLEEHSNYIRQESNSYASDVVGSRSAYSPPTDRASPLVDQLAGSLGSLQIAEDGELRFYGATSNLHLLVNGARQSFNTHPLSTQADVQAILDAAGVGDFVDPELEDHLCKLYFCWEDPSIHFVEEDVFYKARQQSKSSGVASSKFYSEVLVNAMCAVGASLTSRYHVELPEPLVDFFASRARALLDVELDSPTLSTVQSLGILSGVESIRTLDARGWLYSGMAIRLATDLGLHLDAQTYVDVGILDAEEASLRKAVFWGVFIHERMWSLYLGRPVSLNEKAITVPSYTASGHVQRTWQAYVDDDEDFKLSPLADPIDELHGYNATLCAKMTRIRETLYSDTMASSRRVQGLHDFAATMRLELQAWHSALPETLRVDLSSFSSSYVPHVLQLHMQYHCVMVLVNRPFFSANITTLPDVAFSDPMVGRPACTESARSISKLLQIYRRLYSFRRINIQAVHLIFTASLIHVLNACEAVEPSFRNLAWKDLEVCTQALTEMGKGYKNAVRAIEVVNGIKTELLKVTRENAKRNSVDSSSNNQHSKSKRLKRNAGVADNYDQAGDLVDINEPGNDFLFNPSTNVVDTIFWSDFTNLDF